MTRIAHVSVIYWSQTADDCIGEVMLFTHVMVYL
jgi:hypothetical protein